MSLDVESEKSDSLFSALTFLVIEKLVLNPLHALTSVSGVITNVLNLMVLTGLGMTSRSNVGVIALSITDLFMSATEMIITSSYFISYLCPDLLFDFQSMISKLLGWIRYPGFFISTWITTFISIERCVSVVYPFRAKQMFSVKRNSAIILCISCLYMGTVYQIFSSLTLSYNEKPSSEMNSSKGEAIIVTFTFTQDTSDVEMIIDIVCAMFLSILCQVVLIVCTALMICALKYSSQVRRPQIEDHNSSGRHKSDGLFHGSLLTPKERRMIKVTLCLALVITGCNIPRYVIVVLYYSMLALDLDKYYELTFCLWIFSDFLISLYSSCNFFVYLKLNSKFRKRLFWIFSINKQKLNSL
ncbi:neuromedin-U receptor 2 [Biomphalaria glabrata]|nr:neuromedin-U receptor 2-like [Biomphalaria glabrata]